MTKAAAIQMTSGLSLENNLTEAGRLIDIAANSGAALIVLPEFFVRIGKDGEAMNETFGRGKIQTFLSNQAKKTGAFIVGGTIPIIGTNPHKVRSSCLTFNAEGACIARYDKMHLFDANLSQQEIYRESDVIEPGTDVVVADSPVGKLGFMVCFDVRFPALAKSLVDRGAEIITLPSAFTVPTGEAHWEILCRAMAIQNFCYVIAPAQAGVHESKRQTYGHSLIIDPWGKILAERKEATPGVICADIDVAYVHAVRRRISLVSDTRHGRTPY